MCQFTQLHCCILSVFSFFFSRSSSLGMLLIIVVYLLSSLHQQRSPLALCPWIQ